MEQRTSPRRALQPGDRVRKVDELMVGTISHTHTQRGPRRAMVHWDDGKSSEVFVAGLQRAD